MTRPRLTADDASDILQRCDIDPARNFFQLRQSEVEALLEEARRVGYRAPRVRNGSRGRYFHAYLMRALRRDDD